MEKIPTAEEFLAKHEMRPLILMKDKRLNVEAPSAVNAMIEFAKLHVEAALKAQAEQVIKAWKALPGGQYYSASVMNPWLRDTMSPMINTLRKLDSSAYPPENIK